MNKQLEIFAPLLNDFYAETKDLSFDNIPSIFIPHVKHGYHKSERKVFYFGQDTKGWGDTKGDIFNRNEEQSIKEYIDSSSWWLNSSWLWHADNKRILGFWLLVTKLHLRLNKVNERVSINNKLEDKYKEILNDFGWGNIHSIQIPASFSRVEWSKINKEHYKIIKEKSKKLDSVVHTIKAFNPDLIFIFNWEQYKSVFLEEFKMEDELEINEKLDHVNKHFQIIKLKNYNSYIIWTVHPVYLPRIGSSSDKLVEIIMKELREREIID